METAAAEIASFILWPIALGLLGFIEPCAIGATLLFIKTTGGTPPAFKARLVVAFTLSRGFFTGLQGIVAALIGSLFLGLQKAVWLLLAGLLPIMWSGRRRIDAAHRRTHGGRQDYRVPAVHAGHSSGLLSDATKQ